MKYVVVFAILFLSVSNSFAQQWDDLQKLVLTEKAFAAEAQRTSFRQAFLSYIADDGILFRPNAVNGKKFLSEQKDGPEFVVWNPIYADISSNGILGYTTGGYQYYAEGKGRGEPYNGQYFTVWQKQQDGNFRLVVDLGIGHAKPKSVSTDWKSPTDSGKNLNSQKLSAADAATHFFEGAEKYGLAKAYKAYAAADIRLLREGEFPILGRENALTAAKRQKGSVRFGRRTIFFGSADLAYITNTYEITDGKNSSKGNFVQIWKLRGTAWQIVADVFAPTQ